jgi:hypothetical protein
LHSRAGENQAVTTSWHDPWSYEHQQQADVPAPPKLGVRGVLVMLGVGLLLGVVLGLAWCLIAPAAREWSEPNERGIASDGALVVLATLLGLTQGVVLITRGGRLGVARVATAFIAACLGAVVATVIGLWLGATENLGIVGAALVWPVALLGVVGFGEALRFAASRET